MARYIPLRSGIAKVLLWSVISAAFIGPGTVTTAAAAGAQYQLSLLWTLVYATLACMVLQEAAARITIASGYSLGEAITRQYSSSSGRGMLKYLLAGLIVFGCAAYQAGNILGAVSGLRVLVPISSALATGGIALICASFLWFGNYRLLANFLGLVVGLMGFAFLGMALQSGIPFGQILANALIPRTPANASLLIIGLIGTTIVPYNLFLASGIGKGQSITEMRLGIGIAVLIGGIISMAILVVGSTVAGGFTYEALIGTMAALAGEWARYLLGIGLLAAGFSSAITAPLAAAITVQTIHGRGSGKKEHRSWLYRAVWLGVLGVGFGFGVANVRPVPVIILAQGINGVLLPLIAIVLMLAVNDPALMPRRHLNHFFSNALLLLIVGTTTLLGLTNLTRAFGAASGQSWMDNGAALPYLIGLSVLLTQATAAAVYKRRRGKS